MFAGLSSVRSVSLDDNALTTLPEGVFAGLSNLESLSLGGNGLTTLSEGVFAGLSSLWSLDLEGNPGSPFGLALLRANSWCTVQQGIEIEFQQDGKTHSLCEKDGVLTFAHGHLDGEPEIRYSGEILVILDASDAHEMDPSSGGNLADWAEWAQGNEAMRLLTELACSDNTNGFVLISHSGSMVHMFSNLETYVWRNDGWQFEVSDDDDWLHSAHTPVARMISPDEQAHCQDGSGGTVGGP
jgi:hypothetical protein